MARPVWLCAAVVHFQLPCEPDLGDGFIGFSGQSLLLCGRPRQSNYFNFVATDD